MRVTVDTIAYVILGATCIGFGLWSRGRVDQLLEDDPLSDEEHEFRSGVLHRGAITLVVAGVVLLITGFTLLFVRH